MTNNKVGKIIVEAAIEVHRELGGPGVIEDVHEEPLKEELRLRRVQVDTLTSTQRRKDTETQVRQGEAASL